MTIKEAVHCCNLELPRLLHVHFAGLCFLRDRGKKWPPDKQPFFGKNVEKAPFFKTAGPPLPTTTLSMPCGSLRTPTTGLGRNSQRALKLVGWKYTGRMRRPISSVSVCLVVYLFFLYVVLYTCLSPFLGEFCLKHPYTFKSVNRAVTH